MTLRNHNKDRMDRDSYREYVQIETSIWLYKKGNAECQAAQKNKEKRFTRLENYQKMIASRRVNYYSYIENCPAIVVRAQDSPGSKGHPLPIQASVPKGLRAPDRHDRGSCN